MELIFLIVLIALIVVIKIVMETSNDYKGYYQELDKEKQDIKSEKKL